MGTEMVDPELLQTNPVGKKKVQEPLMKRYIQISYLVL